MGGISRRFDSCMDGYAVLVVRRPCLMILSTIGVTIAFMSAAIARGVLPDFESADKGFESRGTALDGRLFASERAIEMSQCSGDLSALPDVQTYHTMANLPDANTPHPTCAASDSDRGDICRHSQNSNCDSFSSGDERPLCAPRTDESDCGSSGRRLSHLSAFPKRMGASIRARSSVTAPSIARRAHPWRVACGMPTVTAACSRPAA